MDALNWLLFFVWLFFNVVETEASPWTINVPSSVKGLPGSCVVIPCSFNYPDPEKKATGFTGIWTEETGHIYHPVQSEVLEQYRRRTELLGDIRHKNCSLKIDPLQESDQGPFHFRVEIEGLDKFSYKEHSVTISMIGKPDMSVSVKEEAVEGQTALASCSMSTSCPTSSPVFVWSHAGEDHSHSQELDNGQWKATSTLTFRPTNADHNKHLLCTAKHIGGQKWEKFMLLKVKHAPVNVRVEYKAEVKEGEAVRLKCSSDAHPPASSYEWFNETGAQLHQGNLYLMPNVSRHTGALFCNATNTVGWGKSSPVRLSVLYAPDIKTVSSCSSEGDVVKCVCIVESKPPCMVHFLLSDRVLSGTKIERHGSVTIGTLQVKFGSSEFVHCLANNTEGDAKLALSLTVNGKMQNLFIAIGVALVIILIAVGFVKKCRGKSGDPPTPPMSAMTANKVEELSKCATVKREEMKRDDVQYPGHRDNDNVYGNVETDWDDDAIYANM